MSVSKDAEGQLSVHSTGLIRSAIISITGHSLVVRVNSTIVCCYKM